MGKNPASKDAPARDGSPRSSETSRKDHLRQIPSVEKLLSDRELQEPIAQHGRESVKRAIGRTLEAIRSGGGAADHAAIVEAVAREVERALAPSLRPVINATGVIIHTNLGRSPIAPALWAEAREIVRSYSNLEFDLDEGKRGRRDEHLSALAHELFGAEAAILTNNNASGVLLLLAATAAGREVIVSRGELVEIGGSFRVPDVMQQGGARLREVGTTNRTRKGDYEAAVGGETAAILRVHRSNFEIVGFTEMPSIADLVDVARRKALPLVYDEGAGTVHDISKYGFGKKETIRELIAAGVDAVTCSTDKLIGATQGGLIIGRRDIVRACARHPLMRALRAGKESYAVIAATLRAHLAGRHEELVPVYRMLATPLERLRERAAAIAAASGGEVVETRCALGGGTTPAETTASIGVAVGGNAQERYARLLRHATPIVGRIEEERLILDVRTILEEEDAVVAEAVRGSA